ncbi:MAG: glycoside hydrolase family 28 protein, partial [Chitinophagaceae bacterium]
MLSCWLVLFACSDAFSAEDVQQENASAKVARTGNSFYNIKDFGATGNGKTLDTKAINDAIDAAAKAGGGTVYFPAGTYLSFSIHLKSNIAFYLDQGSVLL